MTSGEFAIRGQLFAPCEGDRFPSDYADAVTTLRNTTCVRYLASHYYRA
jgi:hypothetical protein